MSKFKEEFIEKLSKLTIAQDSIQAASYWLIFHKKNCVEAVEIFEKSIQEATPDTKLTILYLANDVMQNARKKCPNYITEFSKVLHTVMLNSYIAMNEYYKLGKFSVPTPKTDKRELVKKLLNIWKERNIIESRLIDSIFLEIDSIKVELHPQQLKQQHTKSLPQLEQKKVENPIISSLAKLDKQIETDKFNYEKVSSTTKDIFSDKFSSQTDSNVALSQINTSLNLITYSSKSIETQVSLRNELISLLEEEIKNQKNKINNLNITLNEYTEKQLQLNLLRNKFSNNENNTRNYGSNWNQISNNNYNPNIKTERERERDNNENFNNKRSKQNNNNNNNNNENNNEKIEPLFQSVNFGISPNQISNNNLNNLNNNLNNNNLNLINPNSLSDPKINVINDLQKNSTIPSFLPPNVNFTIHDPTLSLFSQASLIPSFTGNNVNPNEILSILDGNKTGNNDY